jgi:hypothetical protein
MTTTVLAAVLIGIAVLAVLLWEIIPDRRRLERFADRENLSLEALYGQYFAQSKLPKRLVFELWNEIAELLRVPPGKLRPSDRFDIELAPVKGWEFDDNTIEVHWAAQRRLKRLGADADITEIQTLRDYVEFFCNFSH